MDSIDELRHRVAQAERQLDDLKQQLRQLVQQQHAPAELATPSAMPSAWNWPLLPAEYERYSRQLIVPGIGIAGQLRLKSASVLIVGAGGLGCPAAAYLAGAGVGTIGLVDGDVVEVSNLHRQIAHSTGRVGWPKVDSAITYLQQLNPLPQYDGHNTALTPQNAIAIVSPYDIVLDCTDRPATRYLVSDACVQLGKPFISASALRTDGQLLVLNYPPRPLGDRLGGPCYRCIFPKPPPVETVVSCGEGGILGPVVGIMGVLQALEAIKILAIANAMEPQPKSEMLLFTAISSPPFRILKLRGRREDCFACAAGSPFTSENRHPGLVDYEQFCGIAAPIDVLGLGERVTVTEYNQVRQRETRTDTSEDVTCSRPEPKPGHVLVDVRDWEHFEVCSIPAAINVPMAKLIPAANGGEHGRTRDVSWLPQPVPSELSIFVICRVGNDSQLAVKLLKKAGLDNGGTRLIADIKGGMKAWRDEIDPTMPFL